MATTNDTNDTNAIAEIQKKIADATLSPPGADSANPTDTAAIAANTEETKVEESTADGAAAPAQNTAALTEAPSTATDATNAPPKTEAYPTPQQPAQEDTKVDADLTNLIINYLPPTMSEGTLATLFSPYGLLERCKIVVDLQTLRSRGYGFVKYDNASSAERALKALNGYELNGKKLKVAFARQQCKAITNANLYITNIPPHYENENLRKLFRDYGTIVECRVLKDQHGQSRGVGFVRMDTHHNAIQALQAMDQYVIDDKHPPLLVKLAQRRVPRRYWNTQNRGGQNNQNGGHRGPKPQNLGPNGNNRGKKRNSPNRRYAPKGAYRQQGGNPHGGNQQPMGGMGSPMDGNAYAMNQFQGGNGGYHQNQGGHRGAPKSRGYYRPRQHQKQPKPQYQPRRQPNVAAMGPGPGPQGAMASSGAQPYFAAAPAAMYATEPYAMPSYAQPAYGAPIHMATPISSAPSNSVGANPNGTAQSLSVSARSSNGRTNTETASVATSAQGGGQGVQGQPGQGQSAAQGQVSGQSHMVTVRNLPKHFDVGHLINMYAKFGPVQSVKIREDAKAGPTGVVSYFYRDDAQRAQNETNRLQIGSSEPALETMLQSPPK